MAQDNASISSDIWRIYWCAKVFQWLKERTNYNNFDLNSSLTILEKKPLSREAAVVAFWSIYLGNDFPPQISKENEATIKRLLDYGSQSYPNTPLLKDLAFVKLHLAGLLAVCTISPECPIIENPDLINRLEKSGEAYRLAAEELEKSNEIVDDPEKWGNKYFNDDLFTFSLVLIHGLIQTELALLRLGQKKYEAAFWGMTESAWYICAATYKESSDEMDSFRPYFPHSHRQFNIQEVADVFEEIKTHPKNITNWEFVKICCEGIQHLGYCGLYDFLDDVRNTDGEVFGAIEYWGRAIAFTEVHQQMVSSPFHIITENDKEEVRTRERLKRDFFGVFWETMEKQTQEMLVESEIQWMLGRVDNMVKEIRPLLEIELPIIFPLLESDVKKEDKQLVLTRIHKSLSDNPIVRTSIDSLKCDNLVKNWIKKELPKFLRLEVDTRNYFEKRQQNYDKQSVIHVQRTENAILIHKQLLGIGCEGVLPKLMQIKRIVRTNK